MQNTVFGFYVRFVCLVLVDVFGGATKFQSLAKSGNFEQTFIFESEYEKEFDGIDVIRVCTKLSACAVIMGMENAMFLWIFDEDDSGRCERCLKCKFLFTSDMQNKLFVGQEVGEQIKFPGLDI